jgi:hypothetical protein
MQLQAHLAALREVMSEFPAVDAHTASARIDPSEIYFPKAHASALDPERSLVIGNRGMGKSYWASALVNPVTRKRIAAALPASRLAAHQVDIVFGFAEGEGNVGVSRDQLGNLLDTGAPAETIWRAVTLPAIADLSGQAVPSDLAVRLQWVKDEPTIIRDILRNADAVLAQRQGRLMFVFDQLEQLSDDFERRRLLIQGILRLTLAYKSYRNLRMKIFMRPDQRADDQLFQFPDSSKISGEAVPLDWRSTDLYGLLYARLRTQSKENFDSVCQHAGVDMSPVDAWTDLPQALIEDERSQRALFDRLAGQYMGSDRRRGLTYTWLVLHLADSRNQVSPRTFLRAIKFAAEHPPAPTETAIDYRGIYRGVNEAAKNRVDDLKEDYPWVPPALKRLKGLLVPCDPGEMLDRWRQNLFDELRVVTPKSKAPEWLTMSNKDEQAQLDELLQAMATVGVIEVRETTGTVDVPDIFRLPDDIRRRGGVTPQQRRRARLG